jgi:hypothetical protein
MAGVIEGRSVKIGRRERTMNLAECAFIAAAAFSLVVLLRLALQLAKRRWPAARRMAIRWLGFAIAYLGLVVVVSLASPRPWLSVGDEQRFDDWCVTVLSVDRHGQQFDVAVRVSNRGRGRAQSAPDARLVLIADDGREFEAANDVPGRSLRSTLAAGESLQTVCRCVVPAEAQIVGVDVVHGAWPELFIVGDRGSLLHKRPLVRVE